MKSKLFANTGRFTRGFCVCVVCITLAALLARLIFFQDLATQQADPVENTNIVQGDSGQFTYKYNSKVYFSKPGAKGDVLIENPAGNTCLMSVTILDPDTQDSYFYTGFIEPDNFIDTAKLDVELPEGVYQCLVKIAIYSADPPHEPMGSLQEPITLYIGQKPE